MASPIPETGNRHPVSNMLETSTAGNSQTGSGQTGSGNRILVAARFMVGTLASFAITGVLFFFLLALWSILAGPFVRLQSASFVIVGALAASVVPGIWLWRHLHQTITQHRR
ncbi:MAG: hypothetical protein ABIJ86_08890 [Spirochaetota bacterium]